MIYCMLYIQISLLEYKSYLQTERKCLCRADRSKQAPSHLLQTLACPLHALIAKNMLFRHMNSSCSKQ